jgi:hypothetical protein
MTLNNPSMRTTSPAKARQLSTGDIVRRGAIALAASVVANVVVALVLVPLLGISPEFPPFQPGAVAFITALGATGATLAYWLISRFSSRPDRTFRIVAGVVFVVSIIPNILAALDPAAAPFPFPGVTAVAMLALIVLHVVAAGIIVWALTRE